MTAWQPPGPAHVLIGPERGTAGQLERGRGITVAGTPERGAVLAQVRTLLEFPRQQGYGRGEIIQMISDLPSDG
ncbi:MAG: hypothetical protein M3Z75_11000 [Actinomycetota bacterium]|nr:hypothetical protein [Actinomycetota bacterium]